MDLAQDHGGLASLGVAIRIIRRRRREAKKGEDQMVSGGVPDLDSAFGVPGRMHPRSGGHKGVANLVGVVGQPVEAPELVIGNRGVDATRPDVQEQVAALGGNVGQ